MVSLSGREGGTVCGAGTVVGERDGEVEQREAAVTSERSASLARAGGCEFMDG